MSITKRFARVTLKLEGRPRQVAGEALRIVTECDLVSDHSRPIYYVDADDHGQFIVYGDDPRMAEITHG
jgi:hypothetical protein